MQHFCLIYKGAAPISDHSHLRHCTCKCSLSTRFSSLARESLDVDSLASLESKCHSGDFLCDSDKCVCSTMAQRSRRYRQQQQPLLHAQTESRPSQLVNYLKVCRGNTGEIPLRLAWGAGVRRLLSQKAHGGFFLARAKYGIEKPINTSTLCGVRKLLRRA